MKDLYTDLLEVIEPYLSDFTGYDEKEQAFNIVLAVKELLSEFKAENARLQEQLSGKRFICKDCMAFAKKIEQYKQTLQEIKARIPEDYKIYQWYEDVMQLIKVAESEG